MFASQPNYTVILLLKDLLDQGATGHFFHLQVRDTVEPAGGARFVQAQGAEDDYHWKA
jgi:hypothetical protein